MVMGIINKVVTLAKHALHQINYSESQSMILGRIMAEKIKAKESIENLGDIEFKVFSQFGDDGIIQWLVHCLGIKERTFIEFGVGDYRESNTRFLLMNNNWSGLVIDGSQTNVDRIIASEFYWQHNLTAKCAFINTKNINELLSSPSLGPSLGLLHIDLDGNDYWILEVLEMLPAILILEYNSVFGVDRAISVPYDPMFQRSRAHYSNLYYGASLPALHNLATSRGYAFVGCNNAGNNAYFVRRDRMMDPVREVSLNQGFVSSKYRESRGQNGQLTYLTGDDRLQLIRGLRVINTTTGISESL